MESNNRMRTRLVIDCDPGTDDAQSILMALSHSSTVELLALTTVLGNSTVDNTTRNALRILKFANRLDIPVYRGCSSTFLGGPLVTDKFHGEDGMGDVHIQGVDPVDLSLVQEESAPLALVELVNKYPGEITLLAIGPLTNVAAALTVDEEFGKKLKYCVIMGGSLNGCGNVTRTSEFNFYVDPEAAQRVLQGFGRQITLIPLDTCITYFPPWKLYDELINRSSRTSHLIANISSKVISRVKSTMHTSQCEPGTINGYCAYDQLAMAVIIRPDCVLEENVITVAVELTGTLTRGQVVVGEPKSRDTWTGLSDNVRVITKIDERIYHKLLLNTVNLKIRHG